MLRDTRHSRQDHGRQTFPGKRFVIVEIDRSHRTFMTIMVTSSSMAAVPVKALTSLMMAAMKPPTSLNLIVHCSPNLTP